MKAPVRSPDWSLFSLRKNKESTIDRLPLLRIRKGPPYLPGMVVPFRRNIHPPPYNRGILAFLLSAFRHRTFSVPVIMTIAVLVLPEPEI